MLRSSASPAPPAFALHRLAFFLSFQLDGFVRCSLYILHFSAVQNEQEFIEESWLRTTYQDSASVEQVLGILISGAEWLSVAGSYLFRVRD
jgi:hypothetical protein